MLDSHNLRIKHIIKSYDELFWNNRYIVGFGRGLKRINGKVTNKTCLVVFVEKKLSKDSLNSCDVIPQSFNGVSTDVVELGTIPIFLNQNNLASSGDSIGNISKEKKGTFGCVVTETNTKSNLYILSCNHVLCRPFNKLIGDQISYYSKRLLRTAELKHICPLKFDGTINQIDAALALIGRNNSTTKSLLVNIETPFIKDIMSSKDLSSNTNILAKGSVSGNINGIIDTVNTSIKITEIDYADESGQKKVAKFSDIITCMMKSKPGDSGAIGYAKESNKPFGILTGGNGTTTLFCPLEKALDYFRMELAK